MGTAYTPLGWMCVLVCFLRWSFLPNRLPHWLHGKGRRPLCILLWRVSSSFLVNVFPQFSSSQRNGLSPRKENIYFLWYCVCWRYVSQFVMIWTARFIGGNIGKFYGQHWSERRKESEICFRRRHIDVYLDHHAWMAVEIEPSHLDILFFYWIESKF